MQLQLQQRLLVKTCIEHIEQQKKLDEVSRLFYRELFHLDAGLEVVFPGNVVFLNRKFTNLLGALKNLKHLEKVATSIEKMGERHRMNYGVQLEYFALAKSALLTALQQHLREQWTTELAAAWETVFDAVADLMKQAMSKVPPEQIKPLDYDHAGYDPNLLTEIGGKEVVFRVHQRFYEVMFDEPWLGQFFYGKDKETLIIKQTQFMVAAFGGPNEYTGDTPAFIHMHMYITEEMTDLRESILHQAILAEGLDESIAQRWLKVDRAFRPALVKQSVAECVLKCFGQFPVTVKKPANYLPVFKVGESV